MVERVFYIITDSADRAWPGIFHQAFAEQIKTVDPTISVQYVPSALIAAPDILSSPQKTRNAIILAEDSASNCQALRHFAGQEIRPLVYMVPKSPASFWADMSREGLRGLVSPLYDAHDPSSVAAFAKNLARNVQKQILADEGVTGHKQLMATQFTPDLRALYRANERLVTATGQSVVIASQLGNHPEFTTKILLKSAIGTEVANDFKRAIEAYFGTKLNTHHEFTLSEDRRAFSADFPATEWRAVDRALRDLNQELYQPPGGGHYKAGHRGLGL